MKKISIYRPTTVDEAIQILSQHGTEARRLCRRHRSSNPPEEPAGASADLSGRHQEDRSSPVHQGRRAGRRRDRRGDEARGNGRFQAVAAASIRCWCEAIHMISSPELRNASTLGGDLLQEVWCQYLRGGYSCWRNGGYLCYGAIGDNSYYHSAMGGRLCYAVYPGDAATALIPFRARVKLATPAGRRSCRSSNWCRATCWWTGRIQSHVVRFNEILTEVVIPPPKPGVRASFEKLRPRGVWDFAMASLAISLQLRDNDDRRCTGGVSAASPASRCARQPSRAFLKGKTLERGVGRPSDMRSPSPTPPRSSTTRRRSIWRRGCWPLVWLD